MRLSLSIAIAALAALAWSTASAEPLPPKDATAVKRVVADTLKDPMSAVFTDLEKVPRADGVRVACGWVNAKNSYGGYGGKQRFAVMGYLDAQPVVKLGEASARSVLAMCTPQSREQMLAEQQAETKAVCDLRGFTQSDPGPCGVLFAQCWVFTREMDEESVAKYMTLCRRQGIEEAKAEHAKAARTEVVNWPTPVFPKN